MIYDDLNKIKYTILFFNGTQILTPIIIIIDDKAILGTIINNQEYLLNQINFRLFF